MDMISGPVSIIVILTSLSVTVILAVKKSIRQEFSNLSLRTVYLLQTATFLLLVTDLLTGVGLNSRLMFGTTISSTALLLMKSSVWSAKSRRIYVYILTGIMILKALDNILSVLGLVPFPDPSVYLCASFMTIQGLSSLFIIGLSLRMRKVKEVMKTGSAWVFLTVSMEAIYIIILLIYVTLYFLVFLSEAEEDNFVDNLVLCLSSGLYIALSARVVMDSLFVFMQSLEQKIIESMKITQIAVTGDLSNIDLHTKELYDRIQEYFDTSKPYLNGNLTINDLVKVMYTNKLYISRAISQTTGRNFRQYVNYYRVSYSVSLFRNNPSMKIHELASQSGFNTMVSFNMAFRLYMGENPSDWCRKEKNRLRSRKK